MGIIPKCLPVYCVCMFQSENVRWAHSVAQYHEQEETLSGDVLLTAAFISYAGSFSKKYRRELLDNLWMPFLRSQKVTVLHKLRKFPELFYNEKIFSQSIRYSLHLYVTLSFFFPSIITPSCVRLCLDFHVDISSYFANFSLSSLRQTPIPMTEGLDPVLMLTDDAMVAQWNNEGLPGDKMSTQNATILTNCELWH